MLKKTLITLFILATLTAAAANVISHKAPGFLREAFAKALAKDVTIRSVDYRFPWTFELGGFHVREKEPFPGEPCFDVEHIRLEVSPLSLPQKRFIINKLEVANAQIVIRKYRGKLYHALSEAMKKEEPAVENAGGEAPPAPRAKPAGLPLDIHKFIISDSHFSFVDYDVENAGFVVVFDDIEAKVRGIRLPFTQERTFYDLRAKLTQGRDQKGATASLQGWTRFAELDTDANIGLSGVFLPYFRPYYEQVTQARIEDGYLDARVNLNIQNKDLTASVDLEMINLLFQSYEEENQLFGLKADEVLSFLKDSSGRLRFQLVVNWNIADRSVRPRDAIRRSIERSLKSTVLGNIGNILQRTIEKISEKRTFERAKEDKDGIVNKIKSLLK